jgi:predicted amidophosphoribosyltransferase
MALLRMKRFRGHRLAVAVGQTMAGRLGDRLTELEPDFATAIPAPWRRRLVQGTNSPGILAGQLGRELHLPVFPNMLKWRRKVRRQRTLLPAQRYQNVHKALAMSGGYDISGTRALVVDDILTTGATANEAARVLHGAGASSVIVCVAARVADR